MNILMVGHSRSGKTSFMAGMYRYLGEEKDGYGISAKNSKQKESLQKMANGLAKNRYPAGTDVQQMYNFRFTVGGEEIMPFNWMDYRGGILLSDDPDDGDMDNFLKAIKEADALVVFLDGEKLADNTGRWSMEYDILLSCIESSLEYLDHKTTFPINFVITKCDLLPDNTKFYGLERFYSLFDQISQSDTVGAMLTQSVINSEFYYMPFFTLAFCIYGGTPIYISKRRKAMEEAEKRHKRHAPDTFIGEIFAGLEHVGSRIAGILDSDWQWDSEIDLANKAERDFEREYYNLQRLQAVAEDLQEKLQQWSNDNLITLI
jgi:hypothetical protein